MADNMTPIPKEFIVTRQGKDFVLFAGLLNRAHELGIKEIRTKPLQIPTKEVPFAVVHAEVTMASGQVFAGIGDASPESTTKMMWPHILRLSETRAVGRALRMATNIGMATLEELGADADGDDDEQPRGRPNGHQASTSRGDGRVATPAQVNAIYKLAKAAGYTDAEIEAKVQEKAGLAISEMSVDGASKLIEKLKAEAKEKEGEQTGDRPKADAIPESWVKNLRSMEERVFNHPKHALNHRKKHGYPEQIEDFDTTMAKKYRKELETRIAEGEGSDGEAVTAAAA